MNAPLTPPRRFTISQFATSRKLPTLPEVAFKLVQVAQQEEPDYADISRIIRSDPVVSGKILKTVNSALFGFRQKIETIEDAVPKLGLTLLRTLILSFHLSRHETHDDEIKPVLQDLWRSSLTQAVFAEMIAARRIANAPNSSPSKAGHLRQNQRLRGAPLVLELGAASRRRCPPANSTDDHRRYCPITAPNHLPPSRPPPHQNRVIR